jgi:hypothetical protein
MAESPYYSLFNFSRYANKINEKSQQHIQESPENLWSKNAGISQASNDLGPCSNPYPAGLR